MWATHSRCIEEISFPLQYRLAEMTSARSRLFKVAIMGTAGQFSGVCPGLLQSVHLKAFTYDVNMQATLRLTNTILLALSALSGLIIYLVASSPFAAPSSWLYGINGGFLIVLDENRKRGVLDSRSPLL